MSVELDCCLKSASCSPWQAGSRLCVCASISTAIPKMEREGGWGAKRMKYWLALLKAEARSTLCSRGKRGGEGKLKWKSEVTEFIRSVGSEPWTCLWVSVAVPVHVFSLSSGRPHSPQSLCQSSLIVSALSSYFSFFCIQPILWLPSDLFSSFSGESLSGLDGHQREAPMDSDFSRSLAALFLYALLHIFASWVNNISFPHIVFH